jgi:uncharacterized protein (TIGR02246 family)
MASATFPSLPVRLRPALLLVVLSFVHAASVFASPQTEIAAIRADWVKYLHSKQLEPEMALYAQDAVFLQPTGERITGLPAIRKLFTEVMAAVTSEPVMTSVNLEVSGDLAYDSGEYNETLTTVATGARSEVRGGYLMVLKRQPDGQWRIQQQMWSYFPDSGSPKHGTTDVKKQYM